MTISGQAAAPVQAGNRTSFPTTAEGWRALPILVLLYALSILDRQVLSLMVGPIKRDLGLSDFQIGLLQGLVFALFYAVASIPIGWAVDRVARRPIIWVGVTLWSVAQMSCGLAQTFTQLFLSRLSVGIGEATLSPATASILADLFRPARLAFAFAVLLIGGHIGNGLAIGLGGALVTFAERGHALDLPLVGPLASWQLVFFVTGLPGLFLGALVFLVREPQRQDRLGTAPLRFIETFRFMKRRAAFFTAHFVGFGLLSIVGWGFLAWLPVYMMRTFQWSVGQVSLPLAFIMGVGGALGTLICSRLVDRAFERGRTDAHLRVYGLIAVGMAAAGILAFRMTNPWAFLALTGAICSVMTLGPSANAALQIVTPNELRGQVIAAFQFVVTGLGLGLGPTLVGALTDFGFRDEARLGSSITVLFAVAAPLSCVVLLAGRASMRAAVAEAESWRS